MFHLPQGDPLWAPSALFPVTMADFWLLSPFLRVLPSTSPLASV